MIEPASDAFYKIYAIRYGTNARRTRGQNFIKEARPQEPLVMDFFSWLIVGEDKVFVVDTGMSQAKALRHNHDFLADPVEVLRRLGVEIGEVETVIMTHLHFDHAGNADAFPAAQFLLQAEEMAFVTGPDMQMAWMRQAYDVDEIQRFVGYLHAGRLKLHGRDHHVADGVSVHWVGGHSAGQEVVRVRTERGFVVLASDALHYYEEYERGIPFSVVQNVSDMMAAHGKIRALATSDDHIIPGHDPRVLDLYPSASTPPEGITVRVDVPPKLNRDARV